MVGSGRRRSGWGWPLAVQGGSRAGAREGSRGKLAKGAGAGAGVVEVAGVPGLAFLPSTVCALPTCSTVYYSALRGWRPWGFLPYRRPIGSLSARPGPNGEAV